VAGEVSQMFRDGLAQRGIEELPEQLVGLAETLDRKRR
jgi:hypothetical protein